MLGAVCSIEADVERARLDSSSQGARSQGCAFAPINNLWFDLGLATGIQVEVRSPVDSPIPMGGLDRYDAIALGFNVLRGFSADLFFPAGLTRVFTETYKCQGAQVEGVPARLYFLGGA